jgi:hypothetical protein
MRTYQDAVEQAATALKHGEDANWELARLTHENTRTGPGRGEQPGKVLMEQWCADVRVASGRRFSADLGKDYKRIWQRHGLGDPGSPKPPFAEARDALRPGMPGTDERLEQLHRPQPSQTVQNWTPDQKREAARALVRDPEVTEDPETVEDIAATPHVQEEATRQRIEQATRPMTDEQRERRKEAHEQLHSKLEAAISKFSFALMQTLGGWRHLVQQLRAINEERGDLPGTSYDDLVEVTREAALELRYYAATHHLPDPQFDKTGVTR